MSNINQRLNGLNPLAYLGTNALQPTDFVTKQRDPTINDSQNVYLGTWWLNTTSLGLWYLAELHGGVATWLNVTLNGIETLTSNSGGPVAPLAGNINVVGDGVTITGVGNPGTNTLTISVIGGIAANSFPTDSGTAVPAAGALTVHGAHGLNTSGAGSTVTVSINNAITLGDLASIVGSPAITLTTGDLTISSGNINLTNTNTAGTSGIIKFGGNRFISDVGTQNTFVGTDSGNTTTTGNGGNATLGYGTGASLTTGRGLTAIGGSAGASVTTGVDNVAVGFAALNQATSGAANAGANTCIGTISLRILTTGIQNVAVGDSAGVALLTGSYNTLIGGGGGGATGLNYTGAESSNILIMNNGVTGESNVIRIGATGAGIGQQNKFFVAGVAGVTTTVNDAVAVLVSASTGQLGTVSSSRRFKENIEDMASYSDDLMDLRPVMFNYKKHSPKDRSVGLIAEEVEMVMPELIVYDNEGLPQTVKYQDVPVMLLNEFQKLFRKVEYQESLIEELTQRIELLSQSSNSL